MTQVLLDKNSTFYEEPRIRVAADQPIACQVNENFKRFFDICFAALVLLLILPLLAVLAIVIKLNSSGPVFYCQERVTKNNRPFKMLKFRTMPVDVESLTGPVWGQGEDLRTDRLGRFLRITRTDELPQLLNILWGDMSFIGPRPERTCFVEQFKDIPGYQNRHLIRTGLSGYAQVVNPYLSIEQIKLKTELDLYYLKHWSPALDVWIIAKAFTYVRPYAVSALKVLFKGFTR